jgi:hypothetical protein
MSYERRVFKRPGYDCHTACPHTPKSRDHGINSEQWFFSVIGEHCAVELSVSSGQYPASVDVGLNRPPEGRDLFVHARYPVREESIRAASTGEACTLLATGRCFMADYSVLYGRELWASYGDATKPPEAQPPTFWEALEREHAHAEAHVLRERVDTKVAQCPSCAGKGIVERGEIPVPTRLDAARSVLHGYGEGVVFQHDNGAQYEISRREILQLHDWLGRYLASVKP